MTSAYPNQENAKSGRKRSEIKPKCFQYLLIVNPERVEARETVTEYLSLADLPCVYRDDDQLGNFTIDRYRGSPTSGVEPQWRPPHWESFEATGISATGIEHCPPCERRGPCLNLVQIRMGWKTVLGIGSNLFNRGLHETSGEHIGELPWAGQFNGSARNHSESQRITYLERIVNASEVHNRRTRDFPEARH